MSGSNGWPANNQQYDGYNGVPQGMPPPGSRPNAWNVNPPQQHQQFNQYSHSSRSNSYHSQEGFAAPSQNYNVQQQQWPNQEAYGHQNPTRPSYTAAIQQQNMGGYNNQTPLRPNNGFQLNVNAPVFTPRPQQTTAANDYGSVAPNYGGASMYGGISNAYPDTTFYQNNMQSYPQHSAAPREYESNNDHSYEEMYSVGAQQFIPSHQLQGKIQQCGQAVIEVQIGCEQLLGDPDVFDCWAGAIKQRIHDLKQEELKTALTVIVEMAISGNSDGMATTNSQYVLAKLIAFICQRADGPEFVANEVLPVVENFYVNLDKVDNDQKENFMMFTAELFEKVEVKNEHVNALGQALMEQIDKIVNLPHAQITDHHLKKISQVIKLTGRHLDGIDSLRVKLNEVMTRLSGLANGHPRLSETTKALIHSLIELRERNWGFNDRYSDDTIVAPNGRKIVLSDEEQAFLDYHWKQQAQSAEEESNDDPEMLEDFEKFQKESDEEEKARNAASMLEKMKLMTEKIVEEPDNETTNEEDSKKDDEEAKDESH